jgi:hypothetical protein
MSINEKGKGKIMFSFGFLKKMVYGELLGFYVFFTFVLGVHCDIYTSSYSIP